MDGTLLKNNVKYVVLSGSASCFLKILLSATNSARSKVVTCLILFMQVLLAFACATPDEPPDHDYKRGSKNPFASASGGCLCHQALRLERGILFWATVADMKLRLSILAALAASLVAA